MATQRPDLHDPTRDHGSSPVTTFVVGGPLRISVTPIEEGTSVVRLSGEMDLSNAALVADVVATQLARGQRAIRVDVSRLTFLDVSGLRTLGAARRGCASADGELVLLRPTPAVRRLLDLVELEDSPAVLVDEIREAR